MQSDIFKNVIVSGYFNPIHEGHIRLFKAARELGDRLIVIVNNDKQQLLKKGKIIQNENSRIEVVNSIKYVDVAVLSRDEDFTVCKTLRYLAQYYVHSMSECIFANGGDRAAEADIPEAEICKQYNIKMIFSVGGTEKIDSSGRINTSLGLENEIVQKPWGSYEVLKESPEYKIKIITVNSNSKLSLQKHTLRSERWCVLDGEPVIEHNRVGDDYISRALFYLENNDNSRETCFINIEDEHRLINTSDKEIKILEIQYGKCEEDDIVRIEDEYGRE